MSNAILAPSIKMPDNIKKNFIYRKIWNEVWRNESNATFIIIGKGGSGKSTTALRMCQDLDPSFNLERVCFNTAQFLKLLDEGDSNGALHPGNCIIFDEVVTDEGAESRGAMSKTNKLMNYINATYRAMRLVVFYCLPSLMQLDKNLRDVNVTGLMEVIWKDTHKRKNLLKFFWQTYEAKTQKVYYIYPRLVADNGQIFKITGVWFGLPKESLDGLYKNRKMAYLKANMARWHGLVKTENKKKEREKINYLSLANQVKADKERYLSAGLYSAIRICDGVGIGLEPSMKIAAELNRELKHDRKASKRYKDYDS